MEHGTGAGRRSSHKHKHTVMTVLGAVLVAALVASGCTKSPTSSSGADAGAASSRVSCKELALGFLGGLTGDNSNVAVAERNGAKLAIEQFDAAHPRCQLRLEEYDDQADPAQSPTLARQATADKSVIAIIGPPFSGDSKTANPIFEKAGLPTITVSATFPGLATSGWSVFHRAVANDDQQGPAAASLLVEDLHAKRVAVIDDGGVYGKAIADIVRTRLGPAAVVSDAINPKGTVFTATVDKVRAARVDAVFYGGYYEAAGILVRQLDQAGVHVGFVGPDGVDDAGFVRAGGPATEGAILTSTAAPPETLSGGKRFMADYKAAFGADVGQYSAEAFDAANMILHAVEQGRRTRASILAYLNGGAAYRGLTKTMKFRADGEIDGPVPIFAYKVAGGAIVPLRQVTAR